MTLSVVIAGGGTGGHVFPGLALAEALRRHDPTAQVCFVGTSRGLEATAVPAAGEELETVDVLPWARTIGARRFLAPASALRAAMQARRILKRRGASVVAAMGGYASLPAALAARAGGVPLVVHEQNAIPGRANRVSARFAVRVAVTFAESAPALGGAERVRVVGNPVRASISRMDRDALRAEAKWVFGLDAGRRTLLVTGGSRGARRLNEVAAGLAARWSSREDVQILLIIGRGAEQAPAASDGLHVVEFVERMELAYAAADVALARAGAGLAELACASLPSILVPYPYARDDHQRANAGAAQRAGAALVVPDHDATPERIGAVAESLLE
ncbi:MAG: undecaprenyldiphospho-muramoylpentapeptide beta-N-acetylglucosaminyltransferase, partial [Actinomycetota bacterium]